MVSAIRSQQKSFERRDRVYAYYAATQRSKDLFRYHMHSGGRKIFGLHFLANTLHASGYTALQ